MRTRKPPCPIEKVWVDKHKYDEAERLHYEREATLAAATMVAPEEGREVEEAVNGVCNDDSGESEFKGDLKRVKSGKKQRKRKRSPKAKPVASKLDAVLSGLVADHVWFEKPLYDRAESVYRKIIADQHNHEAPETEQPPVVSRSEALQDIPKPELVSGTLLCSHGRLSGCHHVVDGVWINKFDFDKAEEVFIIKSQFVLSPDDLTFLSGWPKAEHIGQRTPDEGYVTALPTPATANLAPDATAHSTVSPVNGFLGSENETVNGKPQISSLQALVSEVWLDKPLYDDAEKNFYEKAFDGHPSGKAKQQQRGCPEASKNHPQGRKNLGTGKQMGTSCLEITTSNLLPAEQPSPTQCFLHETVWLDKLMYDRAESRYYAAQALKMSRAGERQEPSGGKSSRPAASASSGPTQPKKEMAADTFKHDKIWFEKYKYDDAERRYYERMVNGPVGGKASQQQENGASTILRDIARARENIQKSLAGQKTVPRSKEAPSACRKRQSGRSTSTSSNSPGPASDQNDLLARISHLEAENQNLRTVVADLQMAIFKLESRLNALEKLSSSHQPSPVPPTQKVEPFSVPSKKVELPSASPTKKAEPAAVEEDDNDIDLFGSDDEEEDQEAAKVREERLRQYAEKKAKKPGLIAKSSIVLDVKPWDDETDMAKLEECVRSVHMDGLVWGASKLVPVGYSINKLQIQCVVEDDKVGTDILEEEITKFEDYVQSVDIAAFNKI